MCSLLDHSEQDETNLSSTACFFYELWSIKQVPVNFLPNSLYTIFASASITKTFLVYLLLTTDNTINNLRKT